MTRLIVSGVAPPRRPSADPLLSTLAIAAGQAFGDTALASDKASSQVSVPRAVIEREEVVQGATEAS